MLANKANCIKSGVELLNGILKEGVYTLITDLQFSIAPELNHPKRHMRLYFLLYFAKQLMILPMGLSRETS